MFSRSGKANEGPQPEWSPPRTPDGQIDWSGKGLPREVRPPGDPRGRPGRPRGWDRSRGANGSVAGLREPSRARRERRFQGLWEAEGPQEAVSPPRSVRAVAA